MVIQVNLLFLLTSVPCCKSEKIVYLFMLRYNYIYSIFSWSYSAINIFKSLINVSCTEMKVSQSKNFKVKLLGYSHILSPLDNTKVLSTLCVPICTLISYAPEFLLPHTYLTAWSMQIKFANLRIERWSLLSILSNLLTGDLKHLF